MDLTRAMLTLARQLDETAPDAVLTEQVRARLLTEYPDADTDKLYQALLGYVIRRGGDGSLEVRQEPRAHRASGAYYTADLVVRYMLERVKRFCPHPQSLIDPACGSGAFLSAAAKLFPGARLTGLDSDPVALGLCAERAPTADLHECDALLSEVPKGFDLCVGNPPYISSGLRGAAPADLGRIAKLKARFPHTSEYKLNTYPLFIERGLELLRPGGVLAFVLPDSFLSGRYFAGLRRLLLANTILELTLIRKDFWSFGHVGQTVILLVRKGQAHPEHRVSLRQCATVAELDTAPSVEVRSEAFVWGPLQRFRMFPDRETHELVQTMEGAPGVRPLGALVRTYSGLIGRQGQASLLRSLNPQLDGPWGRLLRSGREIDRYVINWQGEEVCLDPRLIKSGGHLPYYSSPKILLRQTSDCLRAAFDDQGLFCLNNVHLLVPREGAPDLQALLGVLNSTLVDRYYRAMTMETGRTYAQVDLDLLACIPIPVIPDGVGNLVRERESAAPEEAAQLERRIDLLVAQAYCWRER